MKKLLFCCLALSVIFGSCVPEEDLIITGLKPIYANGDWKEVISTTTERFAISIVTLELLC